MKYQLTFNIRFLFISLLPTGNSSIAIKPQTGMFQGLWSR